MCTKPKGFYFIRENPFNPSHPRAIIDDFSPT
jgi:hypothetical protein